MSLATHKTKVADGANKSLYDDSDIKYAFEQRDDNHDGFLSYDELRAILLKGHPDFDEKDLRLLWRGLDTDKDGLIDFDEFVNYIYNNGKVKSAKEKWTDTFMAYSGTDDVMDRAEFMRMCEGVGLLDENFTETEAQTLFTGVAGQNDLIEPADFSKAVARIAKGSKKLQEQASLPLPNSSGVTTWLL